MRRRTLALSIHTRRPTEAAIGTAIELTKSPTDLPTEAAIGTARASSKQ